MKNNCVIITRVVAYNYMNTHVIVTTQTHTCEFLFFVSHVHVNLNYMDKIVVSRSRTNPFDDKSIEIGECLITGIRELQRGLIGRI